MLKELIGILILIFPYLFVNKFENKIKGFFYITSILFAFILASTLLTQTFHIFNYYTVLVIDILALIFISYKYNLKESIKNIKLNKTNWTIIIGILVILIVFIQFYSFHYNYTGKIVTVTSQGYQEVKNMNYPYPYYSDEWYSIGFIQKAIDNSQLPILNPLKKTGYFTNLELPFHSFLSHIFILTDLDPVTNYTKITLFFSVFMCFIIYLLLKDNNFSVLPAGITALSLPYIISSANLPGLKYLIPVNLGAIAAIIAFYFLTKKDKKMFFLSSALAFLLYPPLAIFLIISFLTYILFEEFSDKNKRKYIIYYALIAICAALILFLIAFLAEGSFAAAIDYIKSKLIYDTFTPNSIPNLKMYYVIPIWSIILFLIGIPNIYKEKKWLLSSIALGLIIWTYYLFSLSRWVIEFERDVYFTSLLIVLASGFGLQRLIEIIKENKPSFNKTLNFILILIIIVMFIFSFSYSKIENWQKLTVEDVKTGSLFNPASPANTYLMPDDLKLFENLSGKTFLAHPWKGTTIGIATKNYPISAKPGTITRNPGLYTEFMNADCKNKVQILNNSNYKINYLYVPKLNCSNIVTEEIGKSSEGFVLYRVRNLTYSS